MITNSKQFPKLYFGLHFAPGVAQYKELGAEPYKIFLNQDTINRMDPTFEGRPVFVGHREDVNLDSLTNEVDGWVVRSFFNKVDGKQWAEFLVVSDHGHEAIAKGWKLSNAYVVKSTAPGDRWHGVPYEKEVMSGEYDHLALVPDPRYEESIILSPEAFKQYNAAKELELKKLSNSKEPKSMFNFFKKSKVENAIDESMSVLLPKSGIEKSLTILINESDDREMAEKDPGSMMAHPDHGVMFGVKRMNVSGMVKGYQDCLNELESMKAEKADRDEADKKKKENEGDFDKDGHKKENEAKPEEKKEEDKKQNSVHFDTLKNAEASAVKPEADSKSALDPVALGKSLFGSK